MPIKNELTSGGLPTDEVYLIQTTSKLQHACKPSRAREPSDEKHAHHQWRKLHAPILSRRHPSWWLTGSRRQCLRERKVGWMVVCRAVLLVRACEHGSMFCRQSLWRGSTSVLESCVAVARPLQEMTPPERHGFCVWSVECGRRQTGFVCLFKRVVFKKKKIQSTQHHGKNVCNSENPKQ